jgi:phosphatidate phosphatase APP1
MPVSRKDSDQKHDEGAGAAPQTAMKAPSPDKPGLKIRVEEKLGLLDDLQVVGYAGYGTATTLYVEGRLLERKAEVGELGETSLWQNIKNTVKRFDSDEIPGARIRARFGDGAWDTWTDNEGFFRIALPLEEPLEAGWHEVRLDVVESVKKDDHPSGVARVLIPSSDAEFAIVSDLDDTVIKSSASTTIQQVRVILENDATSRAAFAGVEQLYEALVEGPDGRGINPIFYVSRSGWNMYALFQQFLDEKGIPPGPLFLRDLTIRESKSSAIGHENHKRDRIRLLLESYPDLQFVLIGDSGQHDPETYRQIVHQQPGRIRAIYIRDVTPDERDDEVQRIADELSARGVPTQLVSTTVVAGEHAAEHGLITRAALQRIRNAAGDAPDSETVV